MDDFIKQVLQWLNRLCGTSKRRVRVRKPIHFPWPAELSRGTILGGSPPKIALLDRRRMSVRKAEVGPFIVPRRRKHTGRGRMRFFLALGKRDRFRVEATLGA